MIYDKPQAMNSTQLELAWLGSILDEPRRIREKHGLMGLDRSMFSNPEWFDVGHAFMRENVDSSAEMSDELLRKCLALGVLSKAMQANINGEFIPALFPVYAREIEKRAAFKGQEPAWI